MKGGRPSRNPRKGSNCNSVRIKDKHTGSPNEAVPVNTRTGYMNTELHYFFTTRFPHSPACLLWPVSANEAKVHVCGWSPACVRVCEKLYTAWI